MNVDHIIKTGATSKPLDHYHEACHHFHAYYGTVIWFYIPISISTDLL